MKKEEQIVYALLAIVFVIFIFALTATYLFTHYEKQGVSEIRKQYYDILFKNVTIDYESSMNVKLNDEENIITIKIGNLREFVKTNSFSLDVINIGNIGAVVRDYYIYNVRTNVDTSKVNVTTSLLDGMVIDGGKSHKLNIKIRYDDDNEVDEPYYYFDIKYVFDEVIL